MKNKFIKNYPWNLEGKESNCKSAYRVIAFVVEEMLFVEFYYTDEIYRPMWRCVISDKDWVNLNYETGEFNNQQIMYVLGQDKYYTGSSKFRKNVEMHFIDKESKEVIKVFVLNIISMFYISASNSGTFDLMQRLQEHLAWVKRTTAAERHYEIVQRKMSQISEEPKGLKQYFRDVVFKDNHYLYYSKDEVFCSRCGRTFSPDRVFKHNESGSCPKCRRKVIYKASGRIRNVQKTFKELLVVEDHIDEIVFRYFKGCISSSPEMKECIEYDEFVRTYHNPINLNYKKAYYKFRDNYVGRSFWDDKKAYYTNIVYGRKTLLYTGNMDELELIFRQEWLDLMVYWSKYGYEMPLIHFLSCGNITRGMVEKLHKAGLRTLSAQMVRQEYPIVVDWNTRELKKALGISKPMLAWMTQNDGTKKQLNVFQDAFKDNLGLNLEEIIELAKAEIKPSELKDVSYKLKIMKTLHYLENTKGYKNLTETFTHYEDYIVSAEALEYDLSNDTVRYPNDLKAAHDKMVAEKTEHEQDIHKAKMNKQFPEIAHIAKKLNQEFGFKDKKYEIIAPNSAGDIVDEGRILHHCVGGVNYLDKHNTGKTFIMFMRKMGKEVEPYYTIEIRPDTFEILQYYSAYDKKPDKEKVDKFLAKWKKHLKAKVS